MAGEITKTGFDNYMTKLSRMTLSIDRRSLIREGIAELYDQPPGQQATLVAFNNYLIDTVVSSSRVAYTSSATLSSRFLSKTHLVTAPHE